MNQETFTFYVNVMGNTMDSHKMFLNKLTIPKNLRQVSPGKDSDVIFAFVPIVSRAGTDISAAVEKIPEGKPVVLVVLHHNFDVDYIPPDSKLCVKRDRVFAVDCLFHEDQGLLRCQRNDEAIRAVTDHLTRTYSKKKQTKDEHKPLVEHTSYMQKFPVVCIVCIAVVIIVGMAVGIPVGVAKGTAVGIGAGFGVVIIGIIPVIVFLVKYNKTQNQQQLLQSSW